MNKAETLGVMAILREAYPMYYKDKTKEELNIAVSLWQEMFADDDTNLVKAAVKTHIAADAKGFPPVIGQIKDKLIKITQPEQITEQEAWTKVNKAISNSAYHALEEFEKLAPILQKLVGSPTQLKEWGLMDSETVRSVIASNFQRSYRVVAAREKELQFMPNDVKKLMVEYAQKLDVNLFERIDGIVFDRQKEIRCEIGISKL